MRFDFCVELIASFYFFLLRSKLLPVTNNQKKKNDIGTKTYQTKHIAFHQFKSGIFLLQQPQLITVKTVKCELMKTVKVLWIDKKKNGEGSEFDDDDISEVSALLSNRFWSFRWNESFYSFVRDVWVQYAFDWLVKRRMCGPWIALYFS